ncbi:MAG: hypothetical protein ACXAD7_27585 [Candidatus Kariarchaeaceae archaeon]|jgi:amino acid permease
MQAENTVSSSSIIGSIAILVFLFFGGFAYLVLSQFTMVNFFTFFFGIVLVIIGLVAYNMKSFNAKKSQYSPQSSNYHNPNKKIQRPLHKTTTKTEWARICRSCGHKVTEDGIYCMECGSNVD